MLNKILKDFLYTLKSQKAILNVVKFLFKNLQTALKSKFMKSNTEIVFIQKMN